MNQETVTAPGEPIVGTARFHALFPTTERGAHTARRAAESWLTAQQGGPEAADDDSVATASLLIAELTANAALHGRVRGRAARLALILTPATLRIEVTDARGERRPVPAPAVDVGGESGRGLLLVASLADAWGCEPYPPGGKTVWAQCAWRTPLRTSPAPPDGVRGGRRGR
ncbi:ATP-binding protein [Streptomyces sudanensis]|uniref:ATP-binding protein n=1 Tax=Streptomyces sudanensis TaxID=436397 RepID=UPI0020CB889D|nr:ATP-binding protein [Streptomyces sudanensis]MCP9956389.1 ATP-binding protein [Streptomyces sudanensis]